MLELDLQVLPNRIDAVNDAINARITELGSTGRSDERELLIDAQTMLHSLGRKSKVAGVALRHETSRRAEAIEEHHHAA